MALVDNAVYVDGRRSADPVSLTETYELMRQRHGTAWIGLYRPDVEEIRSVAREFELHPLAVEDAITAHQRPKLERYGTTLFTVLRPARYLDDVEEVEFGELHVFHVVEVARRAQDSEQRRPVALEFRSLVSRDRVLDGERVQLKFARDGTDLLDVGSVQTDPRRPVPLTHQLVGLGQADRVSTAPPVDVDRVVDQCHVIPRRSVRAAAGSAS